MQISIDELGPLGEQRVDLDYKQELAVAGAVKPVVGELTLNRVGAGVKLVGNVKTLLKLHCETCLRPYFQALSVDIDELFVPYRDMASEYEMGAPKEQELLKNDFYEMLGADGLIDIDDVVYQAVTLASPVFSRCGDECPGPPKPEGARGSSVSGSDSEGGQDQKPIDPRWKNLKTLFPNQE